MQPVRWEPACGRRSPRRCGSTGGRSTRFAARRSVCCSAQSKRWKLDGPPQRKVAGELVREIRNRLTFLVDVGLEYLTLGRSAPTLSGGESQRIRLASQVGSRLCGVLYVLDEPTIGLHPRDNDRLVGRAAQACATWATRCWWWSTIATSWPAPTACLDFGPAAGRPRRRDRRPRHARPELARRRKSVTGPYLSGKKAIGPSRGNKGAIRETQGAGAASQRDARRPPPNSPSSAPAKTTSRTSMFTFPLGTLTAVTGVSGSGQELAGRTMCFTTSLARTLHRATPVPGRTTRIDGVRADRQGDPRRPASAGQHAVVQSGDVQVVCLS